jgi:hypothetical protein
MAPAGDNLLVHDTLQRAWCAANSLFLIAWLMIALTRKLKDQTSQDLSLTLCTQRETPNVEDDQSVQPAQFVSG